MKNKSSEISVFQPGYDLAALSCLNELTGLITQSLDLKTYLERIFSILTRYLPLKHYYCRIEIGHLIKESKDFKQTSWGGLAAICYEKSSGINQLEIYARSAATVNAPHSLLMTNDALKLIAEIISTARAFYHSTEQVKDRDTLLEAVSDFGFSAKLLLNRKGKIIRISKTVTELLGYEAQELLGKNAYDFLVSANAREFVGYQLRQNEIENKVMKRFELKILTKTDQKIGVEVLVRPIILKHRHYYLCLINDISHQKRQQKRLNRTQHFAQLGSWEHNFKDNTMSWSDELYHILGVDKATTVPTFSLFLSYVHPEDRAYFNKMYHQSLVTRKPLRVNHRIMTLQGQVKHVFQQCIFHLNVKGEALYSEGITLDVSNRVQARKQLKMIQDKLKTTEMHDALTHLANRTNLMASLALRMEKESDAPHIALACLDIDKFKTINDALGHEIGDQLLIHVAEKLAHACHSDELLSRIASDEFAIVFDKVQSKSQVAERISHIVSVFKAPVFIQGHEINVSLSVGIALSMDGIHDSQSLIQKANAALYAAKLSGRAGVFFHETSLNDQVYRRHEMENQLRHAIELGELRLVYQPKFSVQSGEMSGFEVLLRWDNPKFGEVGPEEFIPIAEESKLILEIGDWILQQVVSDYQHIVAASAGRHFHIAINLSMIQLNDPVFIEKVRALFDSDVFKPGDILFELTETSLMQSPHESIKYLKKMAKFGVQFALDDFGMGYSSMRYIKLLPIQSLKIDKSFIRDMLFDVNDEAIVRSIISLGQSLGWLVTAEGVETLEQLAFLKSNHCPEGQGFLISMPLDLEALLLFIEEKK